MIFRDFLREQIDNLMTGDGRDGLAEGRRGTHVEVTFSAFGLCSRTFSQTCCNLMNSTDLLQLVDNLQQAGKIHNLQQVGKIHNLQQVCGVSAWLCTDRSDRFSCLFPCEVISLIHKMIIIGL